MPAAHQICQPGNMASAHGGGYRRTGQIPIKEIGRHRAAMGSGDRVSS